MTWLEFKTLVRTRLTVDAQRKNLADYIDAQILTAVIEIQTHVPCYRMGHETIYGTDDLNVKGYCSLGALPTQAMSRSASIQTTGRICRQHPVVPYPGGWTNRNDLICNRAKLTDCHAYMVIEPQGREFLVFPQVLEGRELHLFWDGNKDNFLDAETVPFDVEAAGVVADYVKAMIMREVQKDPAMYQSYYNSYLLGRTRLFLNAKERQELAATKASPQVDTSACTCTQETLDEFEEDQVELVAFGDSGFDNGGYLDVEDEPTSLVAGLARALDPELLLHLGDTAYPDSDEVTFADQVERVYGNFIEAEQFYLAKGNHDTAYTIEHLPYLADLNAGENYYVISKGPVDIFVLDSTGDAVAQNTWLQTALADSTATWKIVALHHAPYTSETSHGPGSTEWRLDYSGADLVLAGHAHNYERLMVDGIPYVVCGTGGRQLRAFKNELVIGSQKQITDHHGVLHISADLDQLTCRFVDVGDTEYDRLVLNKKA